jgi:hypothetical protein
MALALRRALQRGAAAGGVAPVAACALALRGYAAGVVGACSGTPEAIYERKARRATRHAPRHATHTACTHTNTHAHTHGSAACHARGASRLQWVQCRLRPNACVCFACAPQVFIYSPARTASQQGKALNGTWKLSFGEGERCVHTHTRSRALVSANRKP